LFLLLTQSIHSIEAGEEVRLTHSVARGTGLANDGTNTGLQSAMRALIQLAYPERFD